MEAESPTTPTRQAPVLSPATGPSGEVTSVSNIKLPPFWEEDPDLWFMQVEATFATHRITSTHHRFNLVVSQLPYKPLTQVADLVRTPGETPYPTLKERLISSYGQSKEKKVLLLLEETRLGDAKPSQLLRQMKTIADNSLSEHVLKTIWLRALPNRAKNIVTALEQPLDQLAQVADRILDMENTEAYSVQGGYESQLIAAINELKAELSGHRSNRSRSCSKNPNVKRDRSTRGESRTRGSKNRLCYYHFKFKEMANKCKQPCAWSTRENEKNQASN